MPLEMAWGDVVVVSDFERGHYGAHGHSAHECHEFEILSDDGRFTVHFDDVDCLQSKAFWDGFMKVVSGDGRA